MYSLAAIQYARENGGMGAKDSEFLALMDEYEDMHPEKEPGLFVQMGIAGEPQFPTVGSRSKELEELTRPVAKWLAEKWNPHASVIVTSMRAEVVCGELSVVHDA